MVYRFRTTVSPSIRSSLEIDKGTPTIFKSYNISFYKQNGLVTYAPVYQLCLYKDSFVPRVYITSLKTVCEEFDLNISW